MLLYTFKLGILTLLLASFMHALKQPCLFDYFYLVNSINAYLKFKDGVMIGGTFNPKCVLIEFIVKSESDLYLCIKNTLKSAFKTGFWVQRLFYSSKKLALNVRKMIAHSFYNSVDINQNGLEKL